MAINGNKVTLTSHPDENTTIVDENNITSINDNEFTTNRKLTMYRDGEVSFTTDTTIRFVKVPDDRSLAIIGPEVSPFSSIPYFFILEKKLKKVLNTTLRA